MAVELVSTVEVTSGQVRARNRSRIRLAAAAAWLLRDLESRRLSVSLRAAPDKRHSGHKVRCVESRNPAWYRQLCAQYITHRTQPRRRKPKFVDTLIKRRHVLRALTEIQRGGDFRNTPSASYLMSNAARTGFRILTATDLFSRRKYEHHSK